eukprot:jgi/Galph1/2883/GphlegSOOS_G39.1
MCANNCGLLIAGSEHYRYGGPLPCTFDSYRDYFEPLNHEEYNLWTGLQDYPLILRHHSPQVVEPTGMAPGMDSHNGLNIEPVSSFEELEEYFACNVQPFMTMKHDEYIESLKTVQHEIFCFFTFKCHMLSEERLLELSQRFQTLSGEERNDAFKELILSWCFSRIDNF